MATTAATHVVVSTLAHRSPGRYISHFGAQSVVGSWADASRHGAQGGEPRVRGTAGRCGVATTLLRE
eukprot:668276-Pleurochrysis_carterae.AAC.10